MAESREKTRTLLIVGILVSLGVSVFTHFEIARRRDEAAAAARSHPAVRAREALQEADAASTNNNWQGARTSLLNALNALNELSHLQPDSVTVRRNIVMARRRIGDADQRLGRPSRAQVQLKKAVELSTQIFNDDPTDSRARMDRLVTTREWGMIEVVPAKTAAETLDDVASSVGESMKIVPPTEPVAALLVQTWLDAARAYIRAKNVAAAANAIRSGVTISTNYGKSSNDIQGGEARHYDVISTACKLAEDIRNSDLQQDLERAGIKSLKTQLGLQPEEPAFSAALGVRYGRLADMQFDAGEKDAATKLYDRAALHLESAVTKFPLDGAVKLAYTRALNSLGAFHSAEGRDRLALKNYAAATVAAETLDQEDQRTQLITLGNHAQLLGRVDKIRKARDVAKKAFELAQKLVSEAPKNERSIEDLVSAELRYARLLRAQPRPNRQQARRIAQSALARLTALSPSKGRRRASLNKGLNALIRELR